MVRNLIRHHDSNPYHLLLMGGDQVYADSMFDTLSQLHDWLPLPRQEKIPSLTRRRWPVRSNISIGSSM